MHSCLWIIEHAPTRLFPIAKHFTLSILTQVPIGWQCQELHKLIGGNNLVEDV